MVYVIYFLFYFFTVSVAAAQAAAPAHESATDLCTCAQVHPF